MKRKVKKIIALIKVKELQEGSRLKSREVGTAFATRVLYDTK